MQSAPKTVPPRSLVMTAKALDAPGFCYFRHRAQKHRMFGTEHRDGCWFGEPGRKRLGAPNKKGQRNERRAGGLSRPSSAVA